MRTRISHKWLWAVLLTCHVAYAQSTNKQPDLQVYFSPGGGCQDAIVKCLNEAKKSIRIQAYAFTNVEIAKALIEAKRRGIDCEVILDKSNRTQQYSAATFCANQNIHILIDDVHAIAHNKIVLIDNSVIITGSYNFSRAAEESNSENLLIIRNAPELVYAYYQNYDRHREHSVPYVRPAASSPATSVATRPAGELQGSSGGATAEDPVVYGTKSGQKYHREGCTSLRKSSIPMKLSQAKAKYGACRTCNPPQ